MVQAAHLSVAVPRMFIAITGRSHISRVECLLEEVYQTTPYVVLTTTPEAFLAYHAEVSSCAEADSGIEGAFLYNSSSSYDKYFSPSSGSLMSLTEFTSISTNPASLFIDPSASISEFNQYASTLRSDASLTQVVVAFTPVVVSVPMKVTVCVELLNAYTNTSTSTPVAVSYWAGILCQSAMDFLASWTYEIYVLRRYTSLFYPVLSSVPAESADSIPFDSALWTALHSTSGVRMVTCPKALVDPLVDAFFARFPETTETDENCETIATTSPPFMIRPKNATHAVHLVKCEGRVFYALVRARGFVARPTFVRVSVGDAALTTTPMDGHVTPASGECVISAPVGLSKEAARAQQAAEKAEKRRKEEAGEVTVVEDTPDMISWKTTSAAQERVSRAYYKLEESFMRLDKDDDYFRGLYTTICAEMENTFSATSESAAEARSKSLAVCAKYGWWTKAKGDDAMTTAAAATNQNVAAMDIGAAPGSWTLSLVQRGARTFSVDPGPLSIRHPLAIHVPYVGESPQCIAMVKNIIGEMQPPVDTTNGLLDIVVCDINVAIEHAVEIVMTTVIRTDLMRPGAMLILTVKSFSMKSLEGTTGNALKTLEPYFDGLKMYWLLTNKKERTIIGIRKAWTESCKDMVIEDSTLSIRTDIPRWMAALEKEKMEKEEMEGANAIQVE